MSITPPCPDCGKPLQEVRNSGTMLNDDQFAAIRAGDWYCETCPTNDRGNTSYRYFWDRELGTAR